MDGSEDYYRHALDLNKAREEHKYAMQDSMVNMSLNHTLHDSMVNMSLNGAMHDNVVNMSLSESSGGNMVNTAFNNQTLENRMVNIPIDLTLQDSIANMPVNETLQDSMVNMSLNEVAQGHMVKVPPNQTHGMVKLLHDSMVNMPFNQIYDTGVVNIPNNQIHDDLVNYMSHNQTSDGGMVNIATQHDYPNLSTDLFPAIVDPFYASSALARSNWQSPPNRNGMGFLEDLQSGGSFNGYDPINDLGGLPANFQNHQVVPYLPESTRYIPDSPMANWNTDLLNYPLPSDLWNTDMGSYLDSNRNTFIANDQFDDSVFPDRLYEPGYPDLAGVESMSHSLQLNKQQIVQNEPLFEPAFTTAPNSTLHHATQYNPVLPTVAPITSQPAQPKIHFKPQPEIPFNPQLQIPFKPNIPVHTLSDNTDKQNTTQQSSRKMMPKLSGPGRLVKIKKLDELPIVNVQQPIPRKTKTSLLHSMQNKHDLHMKSLGKISAKVIDDVDETVETVSINIVGKETDIPNIRTGCKDKTTRGRPSKANKKQLCQQKNRKSSFFITYNNYDYTQMKNTELEAKVEGPGKSTKTSEHQKPDDDIISTSDEDEIRPLVIDIPEESSEESSQDVEQTEQEPDSTTGGVFQCAECGKAFHKARGLRTHSAVHHKPSVECSLCNRMFKCARYLKQHNKLVHQSKSMKCPICQVMFSSAYQLERHQVSHKDGKFKCATCKKTFKRKANLKLHMVTHSIEKTYECSTCKKWFTHSANLKRHEREHLNSKQFQCEHCQQTFTQATSLKLHHKRVHSMEKCGYCPICLRGFARPIDLKNHMLIHEGAMFACNHCKKSFTNMRKLHAHQARIHRVVPSVVAKLCHSEEYAEKIELEVEDKIEE